MRRCLPLILLAGCYGASHRSVDIAPRDPPYLVSVTFDSGGGVRFVPSKFSLTSNQGPLDSVRALGGRVTTIDEDSLVVSTYYLVVRDTTARGGQRTIWLGGQGVGFPLLAVVRPEAGVTIGPYRPPGRRDRQLARNVLLSPAMLILLMSWAR